jgi:ribosomal protein S27AE
MTGTAPDGAPPAATGAGGGNGAAFVAPQGPAADAELHRRDEPQGFAADAELHRRDAPRHCPRCGASLLGGAGISVEFWQGADRVFHTWCARCGWTGDIVPVTDMIGHEPEH